MEQTLNGNKILKCVELEYIALTITVQYMALKVKEFGKLVFIFNPFYGKYRYFKQQDN